MAGWMRDTDVTLLDSANNLTHWRGTASVAGGELKAYDGTAVGGLPELAHNPNVRDPFTVDIETVILGNDDAERAAFIARYAQGTVFNEPTITGIVTTGRRYIVMNALPTHNYQGDSTLKITLSEEGAASAGSGSGS